MLLFSCHIMLRSCHILLSSFHVLRDDLLGSCHMLLLSHWKCKKQSSRDFFNGLDSRGQVDTHTNLDIDTNFDVNLDSHTTTHNTVVMKYNAPPMDWSIETHAGTCHIDYILKWSDPHLNFSNRCTCSTSKHHKLAIISGDVLSATASSTRSMVCAACKLCICLDRLSNCFCNQILSSALVPMLLGAECGALWFWFQGL